MPAAVPVISRAPAPAGFNVWRACSICAASISSGFVTRESRSQSGIGPDFVHAVRVHAVKWVTRERPKTDRIACPWLIRTSSTRRRSSSTCPADQVLAVAEREGAHSYDAPGAEYTHRDGLCSFEVLVEDYGARRPGAAPCSRASSTAPTSPTTATRRRSRAGLLAIAEGFHLLELGDHRQLELSLPVYDALYAWCRHEVAGRGRSLQPRTDARRILASRRSAPSRTDSAAS